MRFVQDSRKQMLMQLKYLFKNSVGIGEHPQHIDEMDKLVEKIAHAAKKR